MAWYLFYFGGRVLRLLPAGGRQEILYSDDNYQMVAPTSARRYCSRSFKGSLNIVLIYI